MVDMSWIIIVIVREGVALALKKPNPRCYRLAKDDVSGINGGHLFEVIIVTLLFLLCQSA